MSIFNNYIPQWFTRFKCKSQKEKNEKFRWWNFDSVIYLYSFNVKIIRIQLVNLKNPVFPLIQRVNLTLSLKIHQLLQLIWGEQWILIWINILLKLLSDEISKRDNLTIDFLHQSETIDQINFLSSFWKYCFISIKESSMNQSMYRNSEDFT